MNATIEAALVPIEMMETMRETFIRVLEESIRQEEAGNTELGDKLEHIAYHVIAPAWEEVEKILKTKPKRRAKAK
jgi:hypothetical protein